MHDAGKSAVAELVRCCLVAHQLSTFLNQAILCVRDDYSGCGVSLLTPHPFIRTIGKLGSEPKLVDIAVAEDQEHSFRVPHFQRYHLLDQPDVARAWSSGGTFHNQEKRSKNWCVSLPSAGGEAAGILR